MVPMITESNKENIFNKLIQIAGVIDLEDAKTIIDEGIKFIGFPLRLPVHKPDLTEEEAKRIIKFFPPDVCPVLITYLSNSKEIIELSEYLNVNIVQLHGNITVNELQIIKNIKSNLKIIKSLVVANNNFNELKKLILKTNLFVDAYITDTFDPKTGASGATGKTHDWLVSKTLVELSPRPVILAGGLTPENVRRAIKFVKPAGVDSHTGVESKNGRKDSLKIKKFAREAIKGFNEI